MRNKNLFLIDWATVIAERYMGQERAEEYGRINSGPGELLAHNVVKYLYYLINYFPMR